MKKLITILLIVISINCLSQPYTEQFKKNVNRSTALNLASGVGLVTSVVTGNIMMKYICESIVVLSLSVRFHAFEKANTPMLSNKNQCIINSERKIPKKYYKKYKQQKQKR